jgi:pyridinium-3,5-biscarboxylic acid mononucleotide sulfurtransferase
MGTQTSTLLPPELEPSVHDKLTVVIDRLAQLGSIMVAFSGGVDSALVLRAALAAAPGKVLAATGLSASYAEEEIAEAKSVAAQLGAPHLMVETMELTDPRYADNTHQRCFFCKTELYGKMQSKAAELGYDAIVDGTNADDLGDFRPGLRAANQLGVVSPLAEAGMSKADIRAAAKAWGVPIWNKPAAACLSSRFQYGDPITVEKLRQVATAESGLRALGLKGFRVRHHDETARLEVPPDQFPIVLEQRSEIVEAVRRAGYRYVTLDLEGFRSGSMNEVLNARVKSAGLRRSSAD